MTLGEGAFPLHEPSLCTAKSFSDDLQMPLLKIRMLMKYSLVDIGVRSQQKLGSCNGNAPHQGCRAKP